MFDPEGVSYMICGAGQTDRSSSGSGQFYYAPEICAQFNTLSQLQLQLSEKKAVLFPYIFCQNFLDKSRLEKEKKMLNPSPLQTSLRGTGMGSEKVPFHTPPHPLPIEILR